jgi:hypothetical protein
MLKDADLQKMPSDRKIHVTVRVKPENMRYLRAWAFKRGLTISKAVDDCIDTLRLSALQRDQF